ncbi:MAG: ribosomal L7Ae/L30e/S12e/Gadd45 family protein [Nanoarchaeota archaeon]
MARKSQDTDISDIKKQLEAGKMIIGTDRCIHSLKLGQLKQIYLTSNCPEMVKEDIEHYAKLSETVVVNLPYPNDMLGELCKKPFSISVLGLIK